MDGVVGEPQSDQRIRVTGSQMVVLALSAGMFGLIGLLMAVMGIGSSSWLLLILGIVILVGSGAAVLEMRLGGYVLTADGCLKRRRRFGRVETPDIHLRTVVRVHPRVRHFLPLEVQGPQWEDNAETVRSSEVLRVDFISQNDQARLRHVMATRFGTDVEDWQLRGASAQQLAAELASSNPGTVTFGS